MTNEERNQVIEECAKIAGARADEHDQLKETHYRHSASPFNPADFRLDREVIKWSCDAAMRIRALKIGDSERAENIAKFYGSKGGQP